VVVGPREHLGGPVGDDRVDTEPEAEVAEPVEVPAGVPVEEETPDEA